MADIYLDHVLVAVRSLERSAQTFSGALGFTLTPEGVHPGRGTHNRLIVFGPEYLELIAVRDAAEGVFRPSMSAFLQTREGLYMFALGTSDVSAAVDELRGRGVGVEDPAVGSRAGEPGSSGYTWRAAGVPRDATPGSETFLIQHDNTVRQRYPEPPDATRHTNGVVGVHSLAIAVLDADEAAEGWQRTFALEGEPPEEIRNQGLRRSRLALRNCHLDFVSPMRSGALSRFLDRHGEAPYLLSLEVSDLAETVEVLRQRGVPVGSEAHEAEGSSITVDSAYASGVLLRFLQPSA